MLGMNRIPVIQSAGVGIFDTTRVKDVRAVRVGNSICVTMEVDDSPQVYTADPQMLEYLANTYGGDLDMISTIKAGPDIYEHAPVYSPPVKQKKFW